LFAFTENLQFALIWFMHATLQLSCLHALTLNPNYKIQTLKLTQTLTLICRTLSKEELTQNKQLTVTLLPTLNFQLPGHRFCGVDFAFSLEKFFKWQVLVQFYKANRMMLNSLGEAAEL